MRVRVSFRYDPATGEVEVFQVDDVSEGPRQADHDPRHDAATRDVARIVVPHPIVSEVVPGATTETDTGERAGRAGDRSGDEPAGERRPGEDRRLRD